MRSVANATRAVRRDHVRVHADLARARIDRDALDRGDGAVARVQRNLARASPSRRDHDQRAVARRRLGSSARAVARDVEVWPFGAERDLVQAAAERREVLDLAASPGARAPSPRRRSCSRSSRWGARARPRPTSATSSPGRARDQRRQERLARRARSARSGARPARRRSPRRGRRVRPERGPERRQPEVDDSVALVREPRGVALAAVAAHLARGYSAVRLRSRLRAADASASALRDRACGRLPRRGNGGTMPIFDQVNNADEGRHARPATSSRLQALRSIRAAFLIRMKEDGSRDACPTRTALPHPAPAREAAPREHRGVRRRRPHRAGGGRDAPSSRSSSASCRAWPTRRPRAAG